MNNKKTVFKLLSIALAIQAGSSVAQDTALAENVQKRDRSTIEEIIVTATKRETSLLVTPIAVSAFTQDALDEKGVKNLLDIGTLVPNLQLAFSPSDSGVQVVLRGLTSNNFTEIGDPTVALHFDGLFSPRPQAGLALMFDVERTEINRGPQGTLFGRNSTAGSINVLSARPNFEKLEGKIDVGAGSFDQREFRGWVNIPISDTFALRVSGVVETADSWFNQTPDFFDLEFDTDGDGSTDGIFDVAADGISNIDQRRNRTEFDDDEIYGATNRHGARLSARWQPNDRLDLMVVYDYFNDQSPGSLSLKDCEKAEGTFFACDHDQFDVSVNIPGKTDLEINSIRSILSYEITDELVFESRIGYSLQSRSQLSDGTVAYADPDHPAFGFTRSFFDSASGETIDFGNLVNDQALLDSLGFPDDVLQPFDDLALETAFSNFDSVVAEFQLKSQSDAALQWIAGVFHLSEQNDIRFNVENPFCCGSVLPLAQSFVQPDRTVESTAAFVQFDYAVNDRLNLTAGYRFTYDKKEDKGGSNFVTIGFNEPNVGLFSPDFLTGDQFNFLAYTFLGITPTADLDLFQANDLSLDDGTLGSGFLDRLQSSDNSHSGNWSRGTWKLGMDYTLNDNVFLYGYVATGFKAGGFGDAIDICDCNITETFDYDPEENITFEVGFKSSFFDGKLNILGSAFISDNDNLQQTFFAIVTPNGSEINVDEQLAAAAEGDLSLANRASPCTNGEGDCVTVDRDIGTLLTDNIAGARNMGIELEFDWIAWEGGRVNGWVALLDSKITGSDPIQDGYFCLERALLGLEPCADFNDVDESGNPIRTVSNDGNALPWSPEVSLTVNAEHNWYMNNGLRISPFISVHWQDEIFFDNNNFDEGPFHSGQKAYATADVALRIINEEKRWGIEFFGRNVTDELFRTWADQGPGFLRSAFSKPRHYGVKFNRTF